MSIVDIIQLQTNCCNTEIGFRLPQLFNSWSVSPDSHVPAKYHWSHNHIQNTILEESVISLSLAQLVISHFLYNFGFMQCFLILCAGVTTTDYICAQNVLSDWHADWVPQVWSTHMLKMDLVSLCFTTYMYNGCCWTGTGVLFCVLSNWNIQVYVLHSRRLYILVPTHISFVVLCSVLLWGAC